MSEIVVTFIVFAGVVALTGVVFFGWAVFSVGRFVWSKFGFVSGLSGARGSTQQCERELCRAQNPAHARFCKRCGKILPGAPRHHVRRVA